MARARSRNRSREAQLAFEALSIEGGLLSPEWLSKIAQLAAEGQAEADYRIPKGLNLRDEIGRFWRIAQAYWQEFAIGLGSSSDRGLLAERFVVALMRESFGFASLAEVSTQVLADRSYPIGRAALEGRVPLVVAPADSGLDTPSPAFGDGSRRRSAFGLAQEYLNAQEGALWGMASDGMTLRILRDNASLTRPAWIEADLRRIFTEDRYADFAALWLLVHETRFGRAGQPVTDCSLEAWRNVGREEGTRAREHLRRGVEDALVALGQGFLAHAENQTLRADLQSGKLATKDYFNQLLRLVYRLIFLLTVEERNLLHPDQTSDAVKALYREGYSCRRLRERAVKRSAHDRHSDLWEATKIVFRGVASGEPRLGLPALAGIFAKGQCSALDASRLENRALLLAVWKLAWLREDGALARVNWRDMGPEELGSVYESLLELVPQITQDGRQFTFATGGETKGNARKTTGSYYTPDSLVQVLLDSALEPVIADTIAKNPQEPISALLGLSIVDPACGSGHFLLAAARRLASHVARLQANGTPSGGEYRHALRQVVGHCIYGVDLNPMAVELCKVSLWMEAVEPGLPLTFLNSHIQHGNALLGTTPELMAKGIPDAAWDPIEGDDKKTASALKKRNKVADKVEYDLFARVPRSDAEAQAVVRAIEELEAASDANPEALEKKESQWDGILGSAEYRHQKFVADAWCAAFVWPKQPGENADAAPSNELWRQIRDGVGKPSPVTTRTVGELATQYSFFHWHLQFPQVFIKGGFGVVLGNPPWERVKLQEQEFFASRSEAIADAMNAAARKKLIAGLPAKNPDLWREWSAASRRAEGESHIIRQSGRFPLCGRGDVNTYAVFSELCTRCVSLAGRSGIVVPTNIATDDTTKSYFSSLLETKRVCSLFDFENTAGARLFVEGNNRRFRFCALTVAGSEQEESPVFVAVARGVAELRDTSRQYTLSVDDLALISPTSRTLPMFRTARDADITKSIYSRIPILSGSRSSDTPAWNVTLLTMFHMAGDSDLFQSCGGTETLALYEAKMFFHFDHRYGDYRDRAADSEDVRLPVVPLERLQQADYSPTPRYWVSASEVASKLAGKSSSAWHICWRDICRAGDERTTVAAILPRVGVGHTAPMLATQEMKPLEMAFLYSILCSFVCDYVVRQKVGGIHLTFSVMNQLPILSPGIARNHCAWADIPIGEWIASRVLELTYTAWDLASFAEDMRYRGAPFVYDPARRELLRAELDAAMFTLYGVSRDDVAHIMETFASYDSKGNLYLGVKGKDLRKHGEFRTKRIILEVYDEMAEAARTGKPYQTRLSPPPADPSVAHPPRQVERSVTTAFRGVGTPEVDTRKVIEPTAPSVPTLVSDGSWQLLPQKVETAAQFAVSAVVVAAARPISMWQARVLASLSLSKQELMTHLSAADQKAWKKAVGKDAVAKWESAKIDRAVDAAAEMLCAVGRLERTPDGKFTSTPKLLADPPNATYLGRAAFILERLGPSLESTKLGELKLLFPSSMRDAPSQAVQA